MLGRGFGNKLAIGPNNTLEDVRPSLDNDNMKDVGYVYK